MNKRCKRFLVLFMLTIFIFYDVFSLKIVVSAWGDNTAGGQGRPNYTKAQIDAGALGDKITFNSISDNTTYGDEKNFVTARKYNDTDLSHKWQGSDITVEDGGEYVIRMYVHNNSPKGYNAIARDVRTYFKIPNYSAKTVKVTGYLDSSNATPTEYWDHVNFNSDTAFHLEYVKGSAEITNNVIKDGKATGETKSTALSDDIVHNTKGILIGSESLNGEVPGCFEFTSLVTLRVKAYYDRSYTVQTSVRLVGDADKSWKKEVDAKIGDKVDFLINYTNTSDVWQNNVIARDILPANLKYVAGSTFIKNGAHPDGATINEDDLVGTGIYIGSYAPNANALIRFTAEVVNDNFTCGKFVLHNWGRATVGNKLVQDSAAVNVELSDCPDSVVEPENLVTTDDKS